MDDTYIAHCLTGEWFICANQGKEDSTLCAWQIVAGPYNAQQGALDALDYYNLLGFVPRS